MAQEFLGSGMKFPPQINPATGRFEVASKATSVKESVYIILMTQKSERWIRPEFGSSLMSYTFMDTSTTMLNLMAREIAGDLMRQEPRLADVNVKIDATSKQDIFFCSARDGINFGIPERIVENNGYWDFLYRPTLVYSNNEVYCLYGVVNDAKQWFISMSRGNPRKAWFSVPCRCRSWHGQQD